MFAVNRSRKWRRLIFASPSAIILTHSICPKMTRLKEECRTMTFLCGGLLEQHREDAWHHGDQTLKPSSGGNFCSSLNTAKHLPCRYPGVHVAGDCASSNGGLASQIYSTVGSRQQSQRRTTTNSHNNCSPTRCKESRSTEKTTVPVRRPSKYMLLLLVEYSTFQHLWQTRSPSHT